MSELDEIRTRHEAGERASAAEDREWLLGEIERLNGQRDEAVYALDDAAIEEARAEIDDCRNVIQGMTRDREEVIFHSPAVRASTVADRAVLLGEIERQARHIAELQSKIDAERSCACSYDEPGDVCAAHSPALAKARAEVERWRQARNDALAGGDILKGEVERLRVALEFYADQRSYKTATVHMCGHPVGQPVAVDGGEQARKALEGGR